MIRTGLFRFISVRALPEWEGRGWMFVADGGWPYCLIWRCDCGDEA